MDTLFPCKGNDVNMFPASIYCLLRPWSFSHPFIWDPENPDSGQLELHWLETHGFFIIATSSFSSFMFMGDGFHSYVEPNQTVSG